MESMDDWEIIWTEVGWVNGLKGNTIREGWALKQKNYEVTVWIEYEYLAIHDPESYYPSGCYNIPLDLLDKLHNYHMEKEKPNE